MAFGKVLPELEGFTFGAENTNIVCISYFVSGVFLFMCLIATVKNVNLMDWGHDMNSHLGDKKNDFLNEIKQELELAFNNWEGDNWPLIFRVSDFDNKEKSENKYSVLVKHLDFLGLPKNLSPKKEANLIINNMNLKSSKFVFLPSYDDMISYDFIMGFHLLDTTYYEYYEEVKGIANSTFKSISIRFPEVKLIIEGKDDFNVEYRKISTKEDVRWLIAFINYVLILYLIQS